jgi:ribosomal subunit interface protein
MSGGAMNVSIRIEKVDLVAALRTYIERRLRFSLGRFSERLGRVRVRIADLNAGPGRADKSCSISAELIAPGLFVEQGAVNANLFISIDQATDRIGRSLDREMERGCGADVARNSKSRRFITSWRV